eukprot:1390792-Amorphochlora_amoeboformis.AAC.1
MSQTLSSGDAVWSAGDLRLGVCDQRIEFKCMALSSFDAKRVTYWVKWKSKVLSYEKLRKNQIMRMYVKTPFTVDVACSVSYVSKSKIYVDGFG